MHVILTVLTMIDKQENSQRKQITANEIMLFDLTVYVNFCSLAILRALGQELEKGLCPIFGIKAL